MELSYRKANRKIKIIYLHPSSIYKNVYIHKMGEKEVYSSQVNRKNKQSIQSFFETEREAALSVDKYLLTIGEQPVNILKPKLQAA